MREIYDREQIEEWVEQEKIRENFDTSRLVFRAYCYEKGEYLTAPDRSLEELLFLVEGSVMIYGIRDDGSILPVDQLDSPALIGDLEFSNHGISPFYTEAKTEVICLSLAVKEYREVLDCDVRFLHLLLKSCTDKLIFSSMVDLPAATIEERLLLYMQNICPAGELRGSEPAILQLHCSRRQLQRVLKKLCGEGKIQKTGKGRYRLSISEPLCVQLGYREDRL